MNMPSQKLSATTLTLHWIVALLILTLLGVGFYMDFSDDKSPMSLHKSFGVIALVFVVLRILWRIREGWLPSLPGHANWEKVLARFTHWLLLICALAMPVSGILMSAYGGRGLSVFGWELVARNLSSVDPTKTEPISETWASLGHEIHGVVPWVLLVLIGLHVAGAVKHHVIDKDVTLKRMFGA